MYSVLIEDDFGLTRDELMSELKKEGVGTRAFFVPMHLQPVIMNGKILDKKAKYPVSEYISERGLYLPTGMTLTEKDIITVCRKVKSIQQKHKK